jgi:hypothetical protein
MDVDVGEHSNHLLNHRGVRYPSEDRIRDPHDVSDYVWVVCRVHRCDVAGVEGVVALLHKRQKVCRPAGILGRRGHEHSFSWSVMYWFAIAFLLR